MLEIDIHGMTEQEAQTRIERFIAKAPKDCTEIRIIHGFHSGSILKELVRHPRKIRSKRIYKKRFTMNQGETIYELY